MKKKSIIAILLALVMCFSLAGCGGANYKSQEKLDYVVEHFIDEACIVNGVEYEYEVGATYNGETESEYGETVHHYIVQGAAWKSYELPSEMEELTALVYIVEGDSYISIGAIQLGDEIIYFDHETISEFDPEGYRRSFGVYD